MVFVVVVVVEDTPYTIILIRPKLNWTFHEVIDYDVCVI